MTPKVGQGGMAMVSDYLLYFFDLDGTLLDSKELIARSINASIKHVGKPSVAPQEVYPFIGLPLSDYFNHFIGPNWASDPGVMSSYVEEFETHLDTLRLFPHTLEVLTQLGDRGAKVATLTSRRIENVHKVLGHLGLESAFDYIWAVGLDEFHKPNPGGVYKVCNHFGIDKTKAVLVGDSQTDWQTARNAQIDFVGVSFGTAGRSGFEAMGATRIIDSLEELI